MLGVNLCFEHYFGYHLPRASSRFLSHTQGSNLEFFCYAKLKNSKLSEVNQNFVAMASLNCGENKII